jgi:hypothetical protein
VKTVVKLIFIVCFTDLTEDLAQHEPPLLSLELRHTIENITAECENIYWLEQRLKDWTVRIKSFTDELESFKTQFRLFRHLHLVVVGNETPTNPNLTT